MNRKLEGEDKRYVKRQLFNTTLKDLRVQIKATKKTSCRYSDNQDCWLLEGEKSAMDFEVYLPKVQGVSFLFRINIRNTSYIEIMVNESQNKIIKVIPANSEFYEEKVDIPIEQMKQGVNIISLQMGNRSPSMYLRYVGIEVYERPQRNNWLLNVHGDRLISDINLPGTHDSAAINTGIHTPYACHYTSIDEQLLEGVRVLDIGIKVKMIKSGFSFVTCHGDIGSLLGLNEYDPLENVLESCRFFLREYPTETIVLLLKVDDWSNCVNSQEKKQALSDLERLIGEKIGSYLVDNEKQEIPTLGQMRGKILVMNRISKYPTKYAIPVSWEENTEWSQAVSSKSIDVYVQDHYKGLPILEANEIKLDLVIKASKRKKKNQILLNFASANLYGVFGVYIVKEFLEFMIKERPGQIGWVMFDYEDIRCDVQIVEEGQIKEYGKHDAVEMVIESNVR